MKKFLFRSIASIPLLVACQGAWAAGPTYIDKDITTNTRWTLVNSPYVIANDVTVSTGVLLTIDQGVEVRFPSLSGAKAGTGPNLVIKGGLNAVGDAQNPVSFVPTLKGGFWGSLYFHDCAPGGSLLKGCRIIGGRIACVGSSPTITGCVIGRARRGIEVNANSQPRILGNRIQGNAFGLILTSDTASPTVQRNIIFGNNFGIYLKAFDAPSIHGNRISGNLKYNLVDYSAKSLDVTNNDFGTTDAGLIAKGLYDGNDNPALGRLAFMAPMAAPAMASSSSTPPSDRPTGKFIPQFGLNLGLSGSYLFTGAAYPINGGTAASGYGGSMFADLRLLPWISLGLGGVGGFIPGTDGFRLATFDLGGRLFPFTSSPQGEFYLLGGLGLNLALQTKSSAILGHYHGFAGLGYRFTVSRNNALEVGAQYDYFSPYSQPRHMVSLKFGWTFLVDLK